MSLRRILWSLLIVLGTLAVIGAVVLQLHMVAGDDDSAAQDAAGAGDPGATGGATGAAGGDPASSAPEIAVLTGWDRRRAAAYSAGDTDALRALYRPGSATGSADLALLESYADRGLRVRDMRMQLLAVDVVDSGPRRVVLDVTDRLVGAVAVREGDGGQRRAEDPESVALPADRPDRRRVVLLLLDGAWVVAEARRVGAS